MALWRVDVAGLSHRFVEADSAVEAERTVAEAILRGMDIRATKPNTALTSTYETAGPIQRARLLAAMDGLTKPSSRSSVANARRRLERLIRWEEERQAWVDARLASAPPAPDPHVIDELLAAQELLHIERNLVRFRTWGAGSPLHDEQ